MTDKKRVIIETYPNGMCNHCCYIQRKLERIYDSRRDKMGLPMLSRENLPQWYLLELEKLFKRFTITMEEREELRKHIRIETKTTIYLCYTKYDVKLRDFWRKILRLNYHLIKKGYSPKSWQYPERLPIEGQDNSDLLILLGLMKEEPPRLTMWQRLLKRLTRTRK